MAEVERRDVAMAAGEPADDPTPPAVEPPSGPASSGSEPNPAPAETPQDGDPAPGEDPPQEPAQFIPESFRDEAKSLDPAFLDWIKQGTALHDQVAQREAALAEREQAATGAEGDAAKWQALVQDAELLDHVLEFQRERQGAGGAAPAAPRTGAPAGQSQDFDAMLEGIDFEEASNEEIQGFMRNLFGLATKEAYAAAGAYFSDRVEKPAQARSQVVTAIETHATEKAIDVQQLNAAFLRAVEHYESLPEGGGQVMREQWTGENAVRLLGPFINGLEGTAKRGDSGGQPRAAPPSGSPRGGGRVGPGDKPKHVREGRAPETYTEKVDELLDTLEKRTGRRLTRRDLEDATAQGRT